jgi:methionyl-tRNA synthetase
VTEKEPWAVAKEPSRKAELDAILYNTAESIRALAILLHPVMPETTEKLWTALGASGNIAEQKISEVSQWGQLKPGSVVTKGAVLFPRLEEKA